MTFQTWVAELIEKRFRTTTALAQEVGMELSPFSRGVKAGTLKLENLLRLARVAEEHPSMVLRLAGKSAEADLIESVYGSGQDVLSASEREVLQHWRRLSAPARTSWLTLIREPQARSKKSEAAALKKRGVLPSTKAART